MCYFIGLIKKSIHKHTLPDENSGPIKCRLMLKIVVKTIPYSTGNAFCEPDSGSVTGPQYMQNYNNCFYLLSDSEPLIDFPYCI